MTNIRCHCRLGAGCCWCLCERRDQLETEIVRRYVEPLAATVPLHLFVLSVRLLVAPSENACPTENR